MNSTRGMDAMVEVVTIEENAGTFERARSAMRETRRAIRTHDPDLVLLDSYGTIGGPAAAVAAQHGVPLVARLVSDIWRRLEEERVRPAWESRDLPTYLIRRVSRGLTAFALGRAAGFIAVSTELAAEIRTQTDVPADRVAVVPVPVTVDPAVEGSARRGRESLDVTADAVVLTVTNFTYRAKLEGAKDAVAELAPLLRADPNLQYVVAGGGDYYSEFVAFLDDTFSDPAVRERVRAPGYVDSVEDLYAFADVFVYVSYLDGYPNAVLEAQTAGLPVVANAAHGMRDQVTDGENGVLVDEAAEGKLRERVARLLSDEDEGRRLGAAARARVDRENDPGAVSRRLEGFLRSLATDIGVERNTSRKDASVISKLRGE